MKIHLLLLVLSFSISIVNAQCELENNSFEDWSVEIVEGDGITTTEVMLPDSIFPAIRFLFWTFLGPQQADSILVSDPQGFMGIEQSTDATDGNFAIKLQSKHGELNELADIYYFNSCTQVPDSFAVDIKHVGVTENDNLIIAVAFDQGVPLLFDQIVQSPYYWTSQIQFSGESPYTRYVIPIEENYESQVDTFYYNLVAETSDSSYFLIDNVQFIYNEPSSTNEVGVYNPINLIQNPVYNKLNIGIQESIDIPVDLIVTDIRGKIYLRNSYQTLNNNLEIDIPDLPTGSYILQIRSREGVSTLKFIKL